MYIQKIGTTLKKNKNKNINLISVGSVFQCSANPKQTPPRQSDFFLVNFPMLFIYNTKIRNCFEILKFYI